MNIFDTDLPRFAAMGLDLQLEIRQVNRPLQLPERPNDQAMPGSVTGQQQALTFPHIGELFSIVHVNQEMC